MNKPDAETETTVASLIKELGNCKPNQRVIFGCKDLKFKSVREADDYIVIEFEQSVYRDSTGKIIVVDHNVP